jgi:hypothetical protein
MSMAIKNSMGPNDTNAATNAFFNSVIAKRKKKSSFKMTNEQQSIQSEESPYKYRSSCGRFIYHLSIIDYLQDFNSDKQLENFFKSKFLKKDKNYISAVKPGWYQPRFINFMRDHVLVM